MNPTTTLDVPTPAPLAFFLDMVHWGTSPVLAILVMLGGFGVLPWMDWLVLRGRRASFRACLRATALACAPMISSVVFALLGTLLLVTWQPSRLWSICAGALPLWFLVLWLWCGTLRAHALQIFFSLRWWRAWVLAFAGPLMLCGLAMSLNRI
ncbi:hypothetical protein [Hyalangium gracile]|uniref:hypothetical protein n=1 Tax=Hyalangium gracile TaxID=394092 RepID=UPI001CCB0476|nr:hypothetical protein [Hyalangium gracile]